MKNVIAFHNVDHSKALEFFIEQKSAQVKKMLWRGENFSWVIESESDKFKPQLLLKLRNKKLKISAKKRNVFSAVNEVIEKAQRLVNKDHKKLQ